VGTSLNPFGCKLLIWQEAVRVVGSAFAPTLLAICPSGTPVEGTPLSFQCELEG